MALTPDPEQIALASEALSDTVVSRLGGRRVLDMLCPLPGRRTADWVFPEKRIIVEHKHLESDFEGSARFVREQARLRATFDASDRGTDAKAQMGAGILRLFEGHLAELVKSANQQIRSTAEILGWSDHAGIMILANRSLLNLPPKFFPMTLRGLLQRKFRQIDAILYQTDHYVGGADDETDRALSVNIPGREPRPDVEAFVNRLAVAHGELLTETTGPFDEVVHRSGRSALDGLVARKPPKS